jgi:hypothetical protein
MLLHTAITCCSAHVCQYSIERRLTTCALLDIVTFFVLLSPSRYFFTTTMNAPIACCSVMQLKHAAVCKAHSCCNGILYTNKSNDTAHNIHTCVCALYARASGSLLKERALVFEFLVWRLPPSICLYPSCATLLWLRLLTK